VYVLLLLGVLLGKMSHLPSEPGEVATIFFLQQNQENMWRCVWNSLEEDGIKLTVNLSSPDKEIFVEMRQNLAYDEAQSCDYSSTATILLMPGARQEERALIASASFRSGLQGISS
jgi:hypothetical protein